MRVEYLERPRIPRHPFKKKTRKAKEADPEERAAFQEEQPQLNTERLHFIDEYGIHTGMSRNYARAPKGLRAEVTEPFQTETKLSVISSLSLNGVGATISIEGAVDGDVFHEYVEHFLCPQLKPGDWVVMDNVKFHKKKETIELILATGAKAKYLPAYSPDFNPIEECISKIKTEIRHTRPETRKKLEQALVRAINKVTLQNIQGWFTHCGYTC